MGRIAGCALSSTFDLCSTFTNFMSGNWTEVLIFSSDETGRLVRIDHETDGWIRLFWN